MRDKVITVCVPVYNAEDTIQECLNSLMDSRYREKLDVIVVDDGSTDTSSKVVEEYVDQYPETVSLLIQENHGVGYTYNRAIERAKGKYFLILDDDDYIYSDAFASFIRKLECCSSDKVFFDYKRFYENGKEEIVSQNHFDSDKEFNYEEIEQMTFIHNAVVRTGLLLEKNIRADENYIQYADCTYGTRIGLFAKTVTRFDDCIYAYRIVGYQGSSPRGAAKYAESLMAAAFSCLNIYNDKRNDRCFSEIRMKSLRGCTAGIITTAYHCASMRKDSASLIKCLNDKIGQNDIIQDLPLTVKVLRMNNPISNFICGYMYLFFRKFIRR